MHRAMIVALVVVLGALIFAPAALAQDDNPTGDDLRGEDRGDERGFDDNPTGDDVMASPTATATPTSSATSSATSTPTASATPTATTTAAVASTEDTRPHRAKASGLPRTGGVPWLAVAAGILLVGSGLTAAALARRTS
jgi:cytoskeletal protein RodZ